MSSPFIGQLLLAGFNFTPRGYASCSGQMLPISANTALFSLLGTYYGGDGRSTFGLPNLQGNVAIGYGQAAGLSPYDLGQSGGSSTVTLTSSEVPAHSHTAMAAESPADSTVPTGNSLTRSEGVTIYNNTSPTPPLTPMASGALTPFNGGSQPHNNLMPYLALNWVIAVSGVYPPRQ